MTKVRGDAAGAAAARSPPPPESARGRALTSVRSAHRPAAFSCRLEWILLLACFLMFAGTSAVSDRCFGTFRDELCCGGGMLDGESAAGGVPRNMSPDWQLLGFPAGRLGGWSPVQHESRLGSCTGFVGWRAPVRDDDREDHLGLVVRGQDPGGGADRRGGCSVGCCFSPFRSCIVQDFGENGCGLLFAHRAAPDLSGGMQHFGLYGYLVPAVLSGGS